MRKENMVAKITKIYAILNEIACIIIALAALDGTIATIFFASSLVVNFGIFIVGEIVQLLEDIKNNTARNDAAPVSDDDIPDI